jgi:hypothetical protein
MCWRAAQRQAPPNSGPARCGRQGCGESLLPCRYMVRSVGHRVKAASEDPDRGGTEVLVDKENGPQLRPVSSVAHTLRGCYRSCSEML